MAGRNGQPLASVTLPSGELFGFACNSLGDRELDEEVVQDVFARLWRHAGEYDRRKASVRTWLYSIARNRIVDARRRAAVRPVSVSAQVDEEAWALEDRVSREWEGPGFDPASIEARRQGILERGRAQQG